MSKNLSCTAGATAAVVASIGLTTSVNVNADWSLFSGLKGAQFTSDVTESASVVATVTGDASCTLERTALLDKPVQFRPITFDIGPVPVVIVPYLQFYLDGSGTVHADLRAGASQQFSMTAGIRYAPDNGYSPIQNVSNTVSATPPTFKARATADVGVAPELSAMFYNLAGPRIYARAGLEATAIRAPTTSPALAWTLGLPVHVAAALDVPALKLHSGELTLFDHLYPLARGALGYTPPSATTITTTSLPGAVVGTSYSGRLTTADNRPGTWSITAGALPAGLSLTGNTITGTPTSAGTRTFTVTFDDGDTRTNRTLTLTLNNGGIVKQISGGGDHTCAVLTTDAARCWGSNVVGELGNGTTRDSSTPVSVTGLGTGQVRATPVRELGIRRRVPVGRSGYGRRPSRVPARSASGERSRPARTRSRSRAPSTC